MRVQRIHTGSESLDAAAAVQHASPAVHRLGRAGAYCTNATWSPQSDEAESGDATELALLHLAAELGLPLPPPGERLARFHFDPALRRMTTVVRVGAATVGTSKGPPRRFCRAALGRPGTPTSLSPTSGVTS